MYGSFEQSKLLELLVRYILHTFLLVQGISSLVLASKATHGRSVRAAMLELKSIFFTDGSVGARL
jgi:hypothetical protein